MQMRLSFLIVIVALLVSGCGGQATEVFSTPTLEVAFSTPTLAPTATTPATLTVAPPTITPTYAPVSVTVNAQVNIRSLPEQSSEVRQIVNLGVELIVVGKSGDGGWLAVQVPQDPSVIGWVSVQFVNISKDLIATFKVVLPIVPTSAVPEVGQPGVAAPPSTATIKNEMFVRSGPGQIYSELGTIAAGTTVTLTGRNETNVWVQIKFDKGVNGVGWVAAAYLEGANLYNLPYFNNQGILINGQTSTLPTTIPATQPPPAIGPTPSNAPGYAPAVADSDSMEKPSVNVVFSPTSSKNFQFTSQVSSPNGDAADWFTFSPYDPTNQSTYVYLRLDCTGNGAITSTLYADGSAPSPLGLKCGNYGFALKVLGGKKYTIKLEADGSAGDVRLVDYILYVDSNP